MTDRPFSVLVLCTGNSARSILGEAILEQLGRGRIIAHSAGSKPKGVPHPGALRLLTRKGIDTAPFRSKSWDEFTGPDAPPIDLAITVCGNAAGEVCPVFLGAPLKAHWGCPILPMSMATRRRSMPRSSRRGAGWRCASARSSTCRSKR